jgi:CRP-like cAMP-binding protein
MKENFDKYLKENSKLTPTERETILDSFQHLAINKNDYWIRNGEICKYLAFIQNGILRMFNEIDGEEITFEFVFKNSFSTSLTSFVYQQPSSWGIQALTDCDLLIIDRENHFELINRFKNWLEIDNIQLLLAYTNLESRMLKQIQKNAEERFIELFLKQPEIFNIVPLKYIASFLGITPETLSRLRKKTSRIIS